MMETSNNNGEDNGRHNARKKPNLRNGNNSNRTTTETHGAAIGRTQVAVSNEDDASVRQRQPQVVDDDGPAIAVNVGGGDGSESDTSWELTWPIWHMLPRQERKEIAQRHGMKSIGEFEEYMTLRRAVGATTLETSSVQPPYDNQVLYQETATTTTTKLGSIKDKDDEEEEEEDDDDDDDEDNDEWRLRGQKGLLKAVEDEDGSVGKAEGEVDLDSKPRHVPDDVGNEFSDKAKTDEATRRKNGGLLMFLPDDTLHRILAYLDVDYYGVLALCSPHYGSWTRTEIVYKMLCERCYLHQSKRKVLQVAKFQNSYRVMLELRPRLRTGSGLYVMKYSQVKPIQRDMWTEIPVGAILENTYYRYMYFHETGKVLYCLTSAPPHEMLARFGRMMRTGEPDKAAVWGSYEVRKYHLTVMIPHSWHYVRLDLQILPQGVGRRGGRFCTLSLEGHRSSAMGDFEDGDDIVEYQVPSSVDQRCFRFLRHWKL